MLSPESLKSIINDIQAVEREMGSAYLRLDFAARPEQRMVVVGEFSTGKSSLVNAVLGEEILPVRATPATAVITKLKHCAQPSACVHYLNGSTRLVEPTADGLKALTADRPEVDKVEFLEILHPAVPEGMVIIDTPGTNDISKTRTEIVYRILPSADAVWMVISARAPLKASEVAFLRDKLIGADLTRVHFVVNQVDTLSEEEAQEVMDYVQSELAKLAAELAAEYRRLGSVTLAPALERMSASVPITMLSASQAMEGQSEQVSRLQQLVSTVQSSAIDLQAQRVSHMTAACERACSDIERDIERRRAALNSSQDEINESIKAETCKMDSAILDVRKLSGKFRRTVEDAKQRSLSQVSETFQRIRNAAETASTSPDTVEHLEAELRRELEVIGEKLMREVSHASRGAIAESARLEQLASSVSLSAPNSNHEVSADTDLDSYFGRPSTYFIAMASGLIFGPLGFIAVCAFPFIKKLFSSQADESEARQALVSEIIQLESQARSALSHAVDCEISATESRFMGRIDAHQNTILQLIEALEPSAGQDRLNEWQNRVERARLAIGGV